MSPLDHPPELGEYGRCLVCGRRYARHVLSGEVGDPLDDLESAGLAAEFAPLTRGEGNG